MATTEGYRPHFAMIRVDGNMVGMVQILTQGFMKGRVGAVILDRGPLWLVPDPPQDWIYGFFEAFSRDFPRSWLGRRRIIPECGPGVIPESDWTHLGFRPNPRLSPYQTIWIDLTLPPETIQARMTKSWRYDLRRGLLRSDLEITFSTTPQGALPIILHAAVDQRARGYCGLSAGRLMKLIRFCAAGDGVVIARAKKGPDDVAGAIFLRHGLDATYQTGWVNDAGRDIAANHVLLWRAIEHLAACGVRALDLGGVNDDDARGVAHFKKGLGGTHVCFDHPYC